MNSTVDSGRYLASSITSHCKILKLGSMSSTRLVSGVYKQKHTVGGRTVFRGMGAPSEAIGGLEAEPPAVIKF